MISKAHVTLELPIRIRVPDGPVFVVEGAGARCELSFLEHSAPERADGMRGEGIDDGKGTYLRSTASLKFDVEVPDAMPLSNDEVKQAETQSRAIAWNALQSFLRSYAHVSGHLEALLVLNPEAWAIDLTDSSTGRTVDGFPKMTGQHLPGPISPKRTLTESGLSQLAVALSPGASIPLPDQLLLRAEAEVTLLNDVDHAILDTASALEIFIDQLIDADIHHPLNPGMVRKLRRGGIYSAYDTVLRALGRPSLKDSHPIKPPDDEPLLFELLEFIWSVRNNIIHRGVRQFTLDNLVGGRYTSPYVERHKRFEGMVVDRPDDIVGMVRGARHIIDWVRASVPHR